ncbi:hypothetical protein PZN02_005230 [Sinorhizobium garamanticum]|uniref:Transmembrane protein n=1 Tax=Sinorhizobium garamanticum TaxID=680247 RepID=A0ABY8DG71_9HYPH|nr:hypothetical protein [Sinorhizobium garamanticum]WEX89898.1 hypothetical protein PZN02_005230 [Sinorhizobium garamanticum]
MLPIAFLEHESPGRVRLKVPSKRGDASFFQGVERDLADNGVIGVLKTNHQTGSITIWHTGDIDALRDDAAARRIFELRAERPGTSARAVVRALKPGGDTGLLKATGAGLIGFGLLQVLRGQTLGTASEFFWHSYAAQRLLGSPLLASALGGIGLLQLMRGRVLGSASGLLFYAVIVHSLAHAIEKERERAER